MIDAVYQTDWSPQVLPARPGCERWHLSGGIGRSLDQCEERFPFFDDIPGELRPLCRAIYRKASDIASAVYAARGRPLAHDRGAVSTPDVFGLVSVGPGALRLSLIGLKSHLDA